MRFLCLHGSGTTGDILHMQLASLKQKVGKKHTFDFWDGYYDSKAGPGVGPFFDPPYYVWYKTPSEHEVRESAQKLLSKIRTQRQPYDAVIGFSQGVALLAATILLCKNEYPDQPLPFKGAMFFSGGMPLHFLDNYMQVPQKAKDIVNETIKDLDEVSVKNAKKVKIMMETGKRIEMWDHPTPLWDGKETITRDPWTLPSLDETDVFGLDVTGLPTGAIVNIPAVVVYGHKDPMCPFHLQLAMLCDPEQRLTYDHASGHEIPRVPKVINDLVKAMSWLEEKINATS